MPRRVLVCCAAFHFGRRSRCLAQPFCRVKRKCLSRLMLQFFRIMQGYFLSYVYSRQHCTCRPANIWGKAILVFCHC
uniref:Putative secreted protein n=1 Tax=Ixodes ricinus TaxID=34613 RepID=A0A6B0U391_IXORI